MSALPRYHLAIDVGGTFVDFVVFDVVSGQVRVEKVPSSGPLEQRFFEGIDLLGLRLDELPAIVHGSTLVLNTILQENGAPTGLITTRGFRDVLELGRGNRAEIYNLFYKPPAPLVPRYLRQEVTERLDRTGAVLEPLDEADARRAARALRDQGVQGVAICLLHAYANPAHERRLAEFVAEEFPEAHLSLSSDIVREWREYERTSTTVLNAYTKPRMTAYLARLAAGLAERGYRGSFNVMQSSGGMTSGPVAREAPVRTIQSGPAGGVIGSVALGARLGLPNLVSADVGGTSFDVSLIADGRPLEKGEAVVNRRPVLQPTLDIVSIGAGGGSIAWLDVDGGLRVGPRSAEAEPGPACFGLGGQEATVTDAQLLLGYLDPDYYLGRRMRLDRPAAERAVRARVAEPLGLSLVAAARGINHLANMNMAYAIRNVTIERGHDPRTFALVCFGGGGGLFAGALLRELELAQAIVPVNPAAFSAWGLLNADFREGLARTTVMPLAEMSPARLAAQFAELSAEALTRLEQNGIRAETVALERFAEMRYLGQEHTVRVPVEPTDLAGPDLAALRARFDNLHDRAYAHSQPEQPVELVHLRLSAIGLTPKPEIRPWHVTVPRPAQKGRRPVYYDGDRPVDCPIYDREALPAGYGLDGPAIIEEWTSTTLVLPGQQAQVDTFGNLILRG